MFDSLNDLSGLEKYIKNGLKNILDENNKNLITIFQCILLNRNKKYSQSNNVIEKNNLLDVSYENKYYLLKILDVNIKNNEKLKNYKESFKNIELRNNIEKNLLINKNFQSKTLIETIDKYKIFYNKKNIDLINKKLNYHNDSNLIFLVGFPRSGTTLLDSILRSHSKISVLEEKPILLDLRHEFLKKENNLTSLINITQEEKDFIRDTYFKNININIDKKNNLIIDKLSIDN